jgi:ribosome-binding factor A
MAKPGQVNEILQVALAEVINRELELPNALITVYYVKCSQDQKYATVGVSVLPDSLRGTALKKLRQKSGVLADSLRKKISLRRVPKLRWLVDATESQAQVVEDIITKEEEILKKIIKK